MVIIVVATFAAIMNFANWKTDFLSINPPDRVHDKTMHMEYPPASISGNIIIGYPNNTIKGMPMLSLDVAIQHNGTLTELTPVNVGANGYVYADGIDKIAGLEAYDNNLSYDYVLLLGFEGADFNTEADDIHNLPFGQIYVNLQNDEKATKIHYTKPVPPLEVLTTLKWDIQGDYHPFITILFNNGTSVTTVYPQYKMHVNGPDVVAQENYSRVNTWLSIALFFFALVETPKILSWFLPKKWLEKLGVHNDSDNKDTESDDKKDKSQLQPKVPSWRNRFTRKQKRKKDC